MATVPTWRTTFDDARRTCRRGAKAKGEAKGGRRGRRQVQEDVRESQREEADGSVAATVRGTKARGQDRKDTRAWMVRSVGNAAAE